MRCLVLFMVVGWRLGDGLFVYLVETRAEDLMIVFYQYRLDPSQSDRSMSKVQFSRDYVCFSLLTSYGRLSFKVLSSFETIIG